MIPIPTDPLAQLHWHRACERYTQQVGRDLLPDEYVALADALTVIVNQIGASTPTSVADGFENMHDRLMTHTEVAAVLGVSKTTVGRMVADGRLHSSGSRIIAASLWRHVG